MRSKVSQKALALNGLSCQELLFSRDICRPRKYRNSFSAGSTVNLDKAVNLLYTIQLASKAMAGHFISLVEAILEFFFKFKTISGHLDDDDD